MLLLRLKSLHPFLTHFYNFGNPIATRTRSPSACRLFSFFPATWEGLPFVMPLDEAVCLEDAKGKVPCFSVEFSIPWKMIWAPRML